LQYHSNELDVRRDEAGGFGRSSASGGRAGLAGPGGPGRWPPGRWWRTG